MITEDTAVALMELIVGVILLSSGPVVAILPGWVQRRFFYITSVIVALYCFALAITPKNPPDAWLSFGVVFLTIFGYAAVGARSILVRVVATFFAIIAISIASVLLMSSLSVLTAGVEFVFGAFVGFVGLLVYLGAEAVFRIIFRMEPRGDAPGTCPECGVINHPDATTCECGTMIHQEASR